MEKKSKCTCEQDTCKDDCKRNHTHKTFWCEKCRPEMCLATDEGEDESENCPYCKKIHSGRCPNSKVIIKEPMPQWKKDFNQRFVTTKYGVRIKGTPLEHINFISQTLSTEKARWMKEWGEKIGGMKKAERDNIDVGPINIPDIETQGFNQAIDDIIKLTTPSEQEER